MDPEIWTNQQKYKFWGGGKLQEERNFRQAFCVFNASRAMKTIEHLMRIQ